MPEILEHYISLATKAIFIENILLAYFLGMCSFLALSNKPSLIMVSIVAFAAAIGITLPPPYVPPWVPFIQCLINLFDAPIADIGNPLPNPFAITMISGLML